MSDVRSHPRYNPNQHCTFEPQDGEHDYSFSHTATYCGKPQPRFCGCPFDYGGNPPDQMDDADSPEAIAEAIMRQYNVDNLEGFGDVTMGMIKRMIVAGIKVAQMNDLVD